MFKISNVVTRARQDDTKENTEAANRGDENEKNNEDSKNRNLN